MSRLRREGAGRLEEGFVTTEPCDSSTEILRRLIQPGLEEAVRGELVMGLIGEVLDEIDRKLDAAEERAGRDGQGGSPE